MTNRMPNLDPAHLTQLEDEVLTVLLEGMPEPPEVAHGLILLKIGMNILMNMTGEKCGDALVDLLVTHHRNMRDRKKATPELQKACNQAVTQEDLPRA